MGPAALRTAGIHQKLRSIGKETHDFGDVPVPNRFSLSTKKAASKYLKVIQTVCAELKSAALEAHHSERLPLVLGGDHSLAIGSLAATCSQFSGKRIGLLWVDTHADFNTPVTSPTGNIHGMPVSVLLGQGHAELVELFGNQKTILPENIVFIGLRDIDPEEKGILKKIFPYQGER